MEGALEVMLPTRFLPGELGKSRGPLGTLIFSRNVLLLWLSEGRCSRLVFPAAAVARVAEAGRVGLRKV